ncbi:hypothetical protein TNCT_100501 [Trichonephila clavata]|uniref:Uncharacterized protein n=1 Tax=Trichonephila clavata TaxID=2740835 RepID=A0A8X6HJW0_TRICU|nr:hypothetical protein TNCT_100501 [Trichonephila clavata]
MWTLASKHIHDGTHPIEITTSIAVCIFTESFIPILKMLTRMGIKIGPECHAFAIKRDTIRNKRSEIRASDAPKKARTARLEEKICSLRIRSP